MHSRADLISASFTRTLRLSEEPLHVHTHVQDIAVQHCSLQAFRHIAFGRHFPTVKNLWVLSVQSSSVYLFMSDSDSDDDWEALDDAGVSLMRSCNVPLCQPPVDDVEMCALLLHPTIIACIYHTITHIAATRSQNRFL